MSHGKGPFFRGRKCERLECSSREIRRLVLMRDDDMMESQSGNDDECDGERREEPGAENKFAAEVGAQQDCYDRGEDSIGDRQCEDGLRAFGGRRWHGMKPSPYGSFRSSCV